MEGLAAAFAERDDFSVAETIVNRKCDRYRIRLAPGLLPTFAEPSFEFIGRNVTPPERFELEIPFIELAQPL